jgi:hypothetical protein
LLLLIRGNVSDPPRPAATALLDSIAAHSPQKKKTRTTKKKKKKKKGSRSPTH